MPLFVESPVTVAYLQDKRKYLELQPYFLFKFACSIYTNASIKL